MATTITFLKNYQTFAFRVRMDTSKIYLEKMLASDDPQIKKVMMLRITEELISSTEDLTMWLAAMLERSRFSSRIADVWEYLLQLQATDEQTLALLKSLTRIRTGNGLYRRFTLPPIEKIAEFTKTGVETIMPFFDNLLKAIKSSYRNRTVSKKILLRFHNKVKHGMVIQDYGSGLFIRDFKPRRKGARKSNRNIFLPLDEVKAKKMVGTIEVNSVAVKFLVILFMTDYGYMMEQRKSSGKKLSKKELLFLQESLRDYSES